MQDSFGVPQKLISLQLNSGQSVSFYVRKLLKKDPVDHCPSNKRSIQVEEIKEEFKKQKQISDQCEHIKEIQRLKKQLKERDEELVNFHKIVSALIRKHGL